MSTVMNMDSKEVKTGDVVEITIPNFPEPLKEKAVVVAVNTELSEDCNDAYCTVLLYALQSLFYATYECSRRHYCNFNDDEDNDYYEETVTPLVYRSHLLSEVLIPKFDEKLKEYNK